MSVGARWLNFESLLKNLAFCHGIIMLIFGRVDPTDRPAALAQRRKFESARPNRPTHLADRERQQPTRVDPTDRPAARSAAQKK